MGLLAKTLTRGFRACYFRNQPVHQFYGHLQAVINEISPDGELKHLFARPTFPGNNSNAAQEVEWETELSGNATKFNDLPETQRAETVALLTTYIQKIKNYAEAKQDKTGKEKDYSDYLKAVAVSPDASQIFVVAGKPVLVHWGYFSEDGRFAGQVKYAGWDEFLAEIQRKAPPKEEPAAPAPASAATAAAAAALFSSDNQPDQKKAVVEEAKESAIPAKEAKKADAAAKEAKKDDEKPAAPLEEDELNKSKPLMACGLGAYEWVKWLAIVLAIIILLLLFLPKRQSAFPPPGMMGGAGSMMGGGGGGSGGGGSGGGGAPGGGNGGGGGGQQGGICPHCGHQLSQTAPAGGNPAPAAQPAVQPTTQPSPQQPAQPAPPPAQPGESAPTGSGNQ